MDFGDILNNWERGQNRKNAGAGKNAMEKWLNKNEVYDKDADFQERAGQKERREKLRRAKPDAVIDIHGFTSEQAWVSLDNFFENAKNKGFKKVRIIHGKGNHSKGEAVLTKIVKQFLEKCPFAGECGYEKAPNGGIGASWVFVTAHEVWQK